MSAQQQQQQLPDAHPSPLTSHQQARLNQHKVNVRLENERYLRNHPEISKMLSDFTKQVLLKRPDSIPAFASQYFQSLATEATNANSKDN